MTLVASGVYLNAANSTLSISNSLHVTGPIYSTAIFPTMMQLRSFDLEHPAYQMSVDTLVDMWLVKYGTDWVDADEVDKDPNYRMMMHRLHQLGKLEHCHLIDKSQHVCRLPA